MLATPLRLAVVAAASVPVLLGTALPAAAADSYFSRTTGLAATTQWTQYFDFPGDLYGNVHVGSLNAFETSTGRADVFSFIDDFQCPVGVYPQLDGHGGEQTNGCSYAGSRVLQGQSVPFTVAPNGSSATLKGFLTASTAGDPHSGEGGTTIGQVPADFTWTTVGSATRSSSTYRYRGADGAYYSETFRTVSRTSTMSGRLGPMLFQEAYRASGSVESFKTTSRTRS